MTNLERFTECMEYQSADRRPNFELGVWGQTRERWEQEAPEEVKEFHWDWFAGETTIGMDHREFIPVNFGFIPPFEEIIKEETDEYEILRDDKGIVKKSLKTGVSAYGTRMSMDQFLEFPVSKPDDFISIKKRLISAVSDRYPLNLETKVMEWKLRDYPLILGENCAANGFYWRAREFMGTENLSFAWYDYPGLMHEMMEFFADFIIETSRPVLEKIELDYFVLNEDFGMKGGPLLSPDTFREFIFPHLKRLIEFFHSHGTKYIVVDSDGDPTVLLPLLLDAGVSTIWPIERASNVSPQEWRKRFGKTLRLWGGVDKRILSRGKEAINSHLKEFLPLIEEGGFIPTVDHTVPPEVSWDDFCYYWDAKTALLEGDYKYFDK